MVNCFRNKEFDTVKFKSVRPNLAIIRIHKSTVANFNHSTENDKVRWRKNNRKTRLAAHPFHLPGKMLWTRLLLATH